ncbi:EAL domain-containing protein [Hahella sp. HN01]|nr:EAL domain-containing protein [Hahella sp. HN01]
MMDRSSDKGMDGALINKLAQIQRHYRQSLGARADALEKWWDELLKKSDRQRLNDICMTLHSLAGSGKTFGLPELSAAAAELNAYLQDLIREGSTAFDKHNERMGLLLQLMRRPHTGDAAPGASEMESNPRPGRLVYIVEDDQMLAQWMKTHIEQHGYSARIFNSLTALGQRPQDETPPAILMDVILPEGENAGLDFAINQNSSEMCGVPLVVISKRTDFDARLQAVRAGVRHYLTKPLDSESLLASIEDMVEETPAEPYRILLVDDDEDITALYRAHLEAAGVEARTLSEPRKVLQVITEFKPELIVLDLHMPECTGLEVGQIIRQHVQFANVPLVFLSAESDSSAQLTAIELAGDDFLMKPIDPEVLRINLIARARRARMVSMYVRSLIKEMSFKEQHDALTGLPNRLHLERRLELAIRNVRYGVRDQFSLFLIDVDNFQHINDAYGHELGDQLIVDLSKRLESLIPHSAVLCRPGGDEFAILFKGVRDKKQVIQYAERLLEACETPFNIGMDEISIGLSIGVATYSREHKSNFGIELYKEADMALFTAKKMGKNDFVIFEEHMASELKAQVSMTSDLRKALVNREFHLVYQPQVNLYNHRIFGAEVLLRWNHPVRGPVSPAEFIPVAEAHGLIDQLGEYVLRCAIKQIADWKRQYGRAVRLAVNVSPRQFGRFDFVSQVGLLLEEFHVDGRLLELEITESALAKDIETAVSKLMELRCLGVGVAVDDFGTGFSNLASLKRYPVDLLKIDRSFIRDIPHDQDNLAIVTAIVQMAKTLGLKILAEGVETIDQIRVMRQQGCDLIQGFYVARPMPVEQFEGDYLSGAGQESGAL